MTVDMSTEKLFDHMDVPKYGTVYHLPVAPCHSVANVVIILHVMCRDSVGNYIECKPLMILDTSVEYHQQSGNPNYRYENL